MGYSDSIIRQYHLHIKSGGETPLMQGLEYPTPIDDMAAEGEPVAKKLKQDLTQDAARCC
jgi:homocitrate synthase